MLPSEREAIEYWGNASRVASDPDRAGLEFARALLPCYFYDRKKANAMIQSLRPGVFNLRVNSLMDADLKKIEYDLRPALRDFKRPVLALYGRQDPIGEETALQIHNALSNSILEFIEECGHVPMVEQPEAYFRVVRSFLDKYR
jgi:proline iminopeptidase